jgi:hypothetical protein
MCKLLLILSILLVAPFAKAQDVDPLALMQGLLRQHLQEDAQYRQNERMLLELQRLDLEEQLRYRRLTDGQVMGELARYCLSGEPPCSPPPPARLLQEAARRGLITYPPSALRAPGQDCMIVGLGDGDAAVDCQ